LHIKRRVTLISLVLWFFGCFPLPVQDTEAQERLISSLQELDLRGRSALEVYRSLAPAGQRDGQDKAKKKASRPGKKTKEARGDNKGGANPVKALQGIAKKLGLAGLSARCVLPTGVSMLSFNAEFLHTRESENKETEGAR